MVSSKVIQSLFNQTPPEHTRYIDMLLQFDQIPQQHNILSGLFTWLFLAGFLFFPGTFTALRGSDTIENAANKTTAGIKIYDSAFKIPLLGLAIICCTIATLGTSWLWWKWKNNFVWLVRRIFL
jgi:hypothetical protein